MNQKINISQIPTYKIILISFILSIINYGCSVDRFKDESLAYDRSTLLNTIPLPSTSQKIIDGVYSDINSKSPVVIKWLNQKKVTIFLEDNSTYIALEAGYNPIDSTIYFAGYMRAPAVRGNTSNVYLKINKNGGAVEIFKGLPTTNITFSGQKVQNGVISNMGYSYSRPFSSKVLSKDYIIIGHRGGGRNYDNIPYPENSLKLFKESENMGCKGIELDVQYTKDNIPVILHDAVIDNRLTLKGPIQGIEVKDIPFHILRRSTKLIDGQDIPTFEEALFTILDSTNIEYVWIDNKSPFDSMFVYTLPIIKAVQDKAKMTGRNLTLMNGLPSEGTVSAFRSVPNHTSITSLCELSLDLSKELKCFAYGPRWTLGLQPGVVADAHANNIKVIPWTIDYKGVMQQYVNEGNFDGILTNFPSMCAYYYYIQE